MVTTAAIIHHHHRHRCLLPNLCCHCHDVTTLCMTSLFVSVAFDVSLAFFRRYYSFYNRYVFWIRDFSVTFQEERAGVRLRGEGGRRVHRRGGRGRDWHDRQAEGKASHQRMQHGEPC